MSFLLIIINFILLIKIFWVTDFFFSQIRLLTFFSIFFLKIIYRFSIRFRFVEYDGKSRTTEVTEHWLVMIKLLKVLTNCMSGYVKTWAISKLFTKMSKLIKVILPLFGLKIFGHSELLVDDIVLKLCFFF